MQLSHAFTSDISDVLINRSRERGDAITNLKLQKLLYYAQAWFLALHGSELFSEDFQAWVHGPVLPSQYHRFKHNDWRPIDDQIDASRRTGNSKIDRHLEKVLDVFGVETAPALERMTHQERPWIEARRGLPASAPSKNIISKTSMKKFYKELGKAA